MLWNRSLVMIDSETKSLWSHLLGLAKQGPLEGTRLETLPAIMTDWKTWKTRHPDTTVILLSRTTSEFRTEFYRDPTRFVIGYARGSYARAWSFADLQQRPVLNDSVSRQPLLVFFDAESSTPFLYSRQVAGRVLNFDFQDGKLVEQKTGTLWEPLTGKALEGPLSGEVLKPLPGVISFRKAWEIFHPESTYWGSGK